MSLSSYSCCSWLTSLACSFGTKRYFWYFLVLQFLFAFVSKSTCFVLLNKCSPQNRILMASLTYLTECKYLCQLELELNDKFVSDVSMGKNVNPTNLLPDLVVTFTRAPVHKHTPCTLHYSFWSAWGANLLQKDLCSHPDLFKDALALSPVLFCQFCWSH